ncbi:MAG: hypothetical protein JWN38_179 [Candidatus Saccharibacteria bacterium]|nr:hypothetical protein [Candidatus Saccharibacteria bacterium]
MADLFSKNAFNVLGLDSSATQKDINKRAKELTNLLKIDEVPEYDDADLPFAKPVRTESSVKVALQNLASPNKRLTDYFFWFDRANAVDADFAKLNDEDIASVASKWLEAGGSETAKGFIAKRNLAVLLSIVAANGSRFSPSRGLIVWQSLIDSDKFWSSFTKIYQLSDEVGTSDDAFADLKDRVVGILADYYADLSKEKGDSSYVSEFQRIFKVKGAKVEKDLLAPIYETINDASAKLKSLKISDEKIISKEKMAQLKGLVVTLRRSFEKLKDLGYYNDSQSKTMRDKAAEGMRGVALDLYNNLNDAGKSGSILKIALEISGTPALRSRLEDDLNDLRKMVSQDKVVQPINELLEAEDYEGALELITQEQGRNKSNGDLQSFLAQRVVWCVTAIAVAQFKRGKELYDKNKFGEAKDLLASTVEFVLSYLSDTNISQEYVDNVLAEISRLTALLGKDQKSGEAVDNLRNSVVQQAEKHFKDQFEGTLLTILIDSAIYASLAEKVPELKRKKNVKSLITWAIIIIVIIAISASNSGNSSNNSSSSTSGSAGSTDSSTGSSDDSSGASAAYNSCVDQYNSLKSQLDSINSEMDSDQTAGDTDAYNALVPQQNSLVQQVNSQATQCNGLR